jgi:hypothetical protein
MRIELGGEDELVVVIDVGEVSRLLDRTVSPGALKAGLPGQAAKLAEAAAGMLADPRPREPRTIRSITVRVVETQVITEEPLLLDVPRELYT